MNKVKTQRSGVVCQEHAYFKFFYMVIIKKYKVNKYLTDFRKFLER